MYTNPSYYLFFSLIVLHLGSRYFSLRTWVLRLDYRFVSYKGWGPIPKCYKRVGVKPYRYPVTGELQKVEK